jgi:hypothetical protein
MQFKQTLVRLFFLLTPFTVFSQATTYLPQDAKENVLLERLEIKAQTDSILNFSKIKPFSRKQFVPVIGKWYNRSTFVHSAGEIPVTLDNNQSNLDHAAYSSTKVDEYNSQRALMNSSEWSTQDFLSKKTFLKTFYKSPANFYEVHNKDFFLALNPVLQFYLGKENNNSERLFLNSRGVTLRGNIANKIGFAAYVTDNQERDPLYVQQWVSARTAVPGAGFYKPFKTTGYDYFDARGYITLNAAKFIDIQFGYDKNFIGNGYRSLFLSDFSAPYLFLKLNTRIWKFNYQNLFMELQTTGRLPGDQLIPKKYAAMHHLDLGVTKWLNVGFFEAIIFGRKDHFEFGYLNPVIFYRSLEQQNGSFDNALVGLDAKANLAHKFQFYGQLMLDEFNLSELKKHPDWWGNKFGYQLGANALTLSTLKISICKSKAIVYGHLRTHTEILFPITRIIINHLLIRSELISRSGLELHDFNLHPNGFCRQRQFIICRGKTRAAQALAAIFSCLISHLIARRSMVIMLAATSKAKQLSPPCWFHTNGNQTSLSN